MSQLLIKRSVPAKHLVISTECVGGRVSILVDEAGDSLIPYGEALSGKRAVERLTISLDGLPFTPNHHLRVGFGEKFPDGMTIKEFLLKAGCPESEMEAVIDHYDLTSYTYLTCSQLSQTQARQLVLLASRWCNSKVVVMNDPFQPFSGRWREKFAEHVLEDTRKQDRVTIIINLSFMPQCWAGKDLVANLPIGNAGRKVEKPAEEKKVETDKLEKLAREALEGKQAAYDDKRLVIKVPTILVSAWKVPQDFIFAPLASASKMVRSFAGAAALSAFALVVVLMGVVMFPSLSQYRAKLVQMASGFDSDITQQLTEQVASSEIPVKQELTPVKEEALPDPQVEAPDEIEAVDELVPESDLDNVVVAMLAGADTLYPQAEATQDIIDLTHEGQETAHILVAPAPEVTGEFAAYCKPERHLAYLFFSCDLGGKL